MISQLLVHMYGTRREGDGWHCEHTECLVKDMGFVQGTASSCVFHHSEKDIMTSVYGDDFTATSCAEDLDLFRQMLETKYELTESARLGPGPEDSKEARILNRIVRWTDSGLEYEGDPRQAEQLVRDLRVVGGKSVGTLGCKASSEQVANDQPLDSSRQTPFRAVAARSNYLSADKPECQFATKEVCRWMAGPTGIRPRCAEENRKVYRWATTTGIHI